MNVSLAAATRAITALNFYEGSYEPDDDALSREKLLADLLTDVVHLFGPAVLAAASERALSHYAAEIRDLDPPDSEVSDSEV